MAYVGIYVLRCLKEELAWARDKWLWIIIIWCYLKHLYHQETIKNKATLSLTGGERFEHWDFTDC